MKLEINKFYSIGALIEIIKQKSDRDFDNYGKEKYNFDNCYSVYIPINEELIEDSILYIGKPVEFDDDDNEIYPKEILENSLEFCYSDEHFQSVIDFAFSQKNNASISEFIKCLDYYSKRDTFLDL